MYSFSSLNYCSLHRLTFFSSTTFRISDSLTFNEFFEITKFEYVNSGKRDRDWLAVTGKICLVFALFAHCLASCIICTLFGELLCAPP